MHVPIVHLSDLSSATHSSAGSNNLEITDMREPKLIDFLEQRGLIERRLIVSMKPHQHASCCLYTLIRFGIDSSSICLDVALAVGNLGALTRLIEPPGVVRAHHAVGFNVPSVAEVCAEVRTEGMERTDLTPPHPVSGHA